MNQVFVWLNKLLAWRMIYSDFLREMMIAEFGNKRFTHERLLKAESSLWRLIRKQTLFTFWNVLILQYLQQIIVLKVE